MIIVLTRFPIKKEFKGNFESRAKEKFGEHGISQMEGFMGMKILSGQSFPSMPENNNVLIITYWKDMESFLNYTNNEAFKKAHENPPPKEWFAGPPSVEIYELIKEL